MVTNVFINIRILLLYPMLINRLTRLYHMYLIGSTAENEEKIGYLYIHNFNANIVTS